MLILPPDSKDKVGEMLQSRKMERFVLCDAVLLSLALLMAIPVSHVWFPVILFCPFLNDFCCLTFFLVPFRNDDK